MEFKRVNLLLLLISMAFAPGLHANNDTMNNYNNTKKIRTFYRSR